MDYTTLKTNPSNPRLIKKDQFERLKKSIGGFTKMLEVRPIAYDEDGVIWGGNMRYEALKALGIEMKPEYFKELTGYTLDEKREFAIRDNIELGEWDDDILANEWSDLPLDDWGIDTKGWEERNDEETRRKLADMFIVPPFTVLDTRQGYWQDRKRTWIDLGISSEVGRHDNLLGMSETAKIGVYRGKSAFYQESLDRIQGQERTGTSIFDPVLCELAYKWFCTNNGKILDPFAGGSVRGIVAGYLGYEYFGNDLSDEQIEANRQQAKGIELKKNPTWTIGDSINIKELLGGEYDFIFSCPPYFDLEVYGDKEGELSSMSWEEFIPAYKKIITDSVSMLKDDRFACFVVGDVRDKDGFYRNFVSLTIDAFQESGMTLYNEAILVNAIGSLPIRIKKQFGSYRKLGKCHQNVLVFYKGNIKEIKDNYQEIEIKLKDGWENGTE